MAKTKHPGVYSYDTADGERFYFSFRDSDGKQSSRRGFASAQAAAKAKAGATVQSGAGALHLSTARFGDYFATWLAGHKPFVQPGTWADYRVHGDKRLIPEFGDKRLDEIATADVREWLAEASASGLYSPKTLNNALGVLVVCLNTAADDRLIQTNPAARVKRLPAAHLEREYLRLDEIDRYLDACSAAYRPLAELLVTCGLRISEALGLTWADIDLRRGAITVIRQATRGGGTDRTKGGRGRSVDAGPDLLRRLTDLRARQAELYSDLRDRPVFVMERRGKLSAGDVRVIACSASPQKDIAKRFGIDPSTVSQIRAGKAWTPALDGRVIDRNTVSRDWHKAALQDAGLRDMPLHALRHTAAASWLFTGQPLVYVQRMLGHASITTTEKFYGHLEESILKTAARDTETAIRAAGRA